MSPGRGDRAGPGGRPEGGSGASGAGERAGAIGVKRLSELLILEPATVSPLVKRLEAQGLLTRRRHEEDERQLQVVLTDEGRALRSKAEKIPPAIAERLQMTPDEFAHLKSALDRLLTAMA